MYLTNWGENNGFRSYTVDRNSLMKSVSNDETLLKEGYIYSCLVTILLTLGEK